ncbi:MAG: hypothetical protein ACXIVQ_07680 [Acidimicrobiales bacterium]
MPTAPGLDLYWIPLGAGTRVVRLSGRVYEWLAARRDRRRAAPIYHAALVATLAEGEVTIEMTPIPRRGEASDRGVVATGPVGSALLGRWRVFRYEIRRWTGGTIPDLEHAVGPPVRVTSDVSLAGAVLDALPSVPRAVWGRDELDTGEMWNSNSVVAWALARAGLDQMAGSPPGGGRAPGWAAGLAVAARS